MSNRFDKKFTYKRIEFNVLTNKKCSKKGGKVDSVNCVQIIFIYSYKFYMHCERLKIFIGVGEGNNQKLNLDLNNSCN